MKILSLSLPGQGQIKVPGEIPTGGLFSTGEKTIAVGVNVLILFAIIYALFSVMLSGIQWITSEGDKQRLQSARTRLTYSILGLVIVLISALIVNIIGALFGITLLTPH